MTQLDLPAFDDSPTPSDLRICWGDDLTALAAALADATAAEPLADPFATETVVVGSRVMAGWLRQFLVMDHAPTARQRVIAGWDFQFLHVFVNDWLHRLSLVLAAADDPGSGGPATVVETRRDPARHPYSPLALQWRIDRLLAGDLLRQPDMAGLHAYLGDTPPPLRRFQLAGTLAKLFDEYQVYRPTMLDAWERRGAAALPDLPDRDNFRWQPALWQRLVADEPGSYLAQFRHMPRAFAAATQSPTLDPRRLQRLHIFGISHMPAVYLAFFHELARLIPVTLYTTNACRDYWEQDVDARQYAREHLRLQGAESPDDLHLELGNPLLSAWGKANQQFLSELSAYADMPTGYFRQDQPDSLLTRLQTDIRNRDCATPNPEAASADDGSIAIQLCHSPQREIEILRDQLLRCFSQDADTPDAPRLQPRDVQIQLADMATYMPYIDAVFGSIGRQSPATIPYVVADRFVVGESSVARAFFTLLNLHTSRFTSPDVLDILECAAVRERLELTASDVAQLRDWTRDCAVYWGLDAQHRQERSGAMFESIGSWEHGLQRMILGLITGSDSVDGPDRPWTLADGRPVLAFETTEGHGATLVGKLYRLLDELREIHACMRRSQSLATWQQQIRAWVDRLFANTNETFQDIVVIQRAINSLETAARTAGIDDDALPGDLIAAFLQDQVSQAESQDNLSQNAVVVSALRPMSSTPRRIQCLVGMSDGVYPHEDGRAQFDLIARQPHRLDPLRRWQDRQAVLEATMAARERLYISYLGRTADANEPLPPSTVIAELRDYLIGFTGLREDDATALLPIERLHRLQAFHPAYFTDDSALFSHSQVNRAAARALADPSRHAATPPDPLIQADQARALLADEPDRDDGAITLDELQRYFRNPAKAYYRRTLQVRFDTDTLTVLPEHEPFELDALQRYTLRDAIADACRQLPDPAQPPAAVRDALHERLKQSGHVPLGRPGLDLLDDEWEAVSEQLGSLVEDPLDMTLHALLRLPADTCLVQVELPGTSIQGVIRPRQAQGYNLLLTSTLSSLKAHRQLLAWIQHLVGSAAGHELHSVVVGLKNKQLKSVHFPPIPADQARELLIDLLALRAEWLAAPMPFAPESSHTYHVQYEKHGDGDEAATKIARAVERAWGPSTDNFLEGNDPYLARAFGAEGPLLRAPDTFAAIAKRVFTPMTGGDDDDAEEDDA